jgi:hypothetical protein
MQLQHACHDTLPWLISFSLDATPSDHGNAKISRLSSGRARGAHLASIRHFRCSLWPIATQRRSARARAKNCGSSAAFQSAASRAANRALRRCGCNARMATRRRSDRSVPLIERDRALELRTAARASKRGSSQRSTAQPPPILNSARRHCTSPRRGRRVEWSGQRRGNVRLHFRARLFCRRCASDASYESVGNAGSIDVTTTDIALRTDSV